MSPEERQLLTGLFDRIRASANTPRDPEAEALIADAVKTQPYSPYFLAQAVIVQNQALEAANQRLNELQAQINSQQPQGQPAAGGFLSSLGSIFGGPWGQSPQAQAPRTYPPQPSYPPQTPWGAPPVGGGGGGFLSGALQGAAGVAGGVLLADSIRNLFGGHGGGFGGLGIGTGVGGLGSGLGGGETVVNNYYDDDGSKNGADSVDIYDDSNNGTDSFDTGNDNNGSFDV